MLNPFVTLPYTDQPAKQKDTKHFYLPLTDFIFKSQYKWSAVLAFFWWTLVWAFSYKSWRCIVTSDRHIIVGCVFPWEIQCSGPPIIQSRDNLILLAPISRSLPLQTSTWLRVRRKVESQHLVSLWGQEKADWPRMWEVRLCPTVKI